MTENLSDGHLLRSARRLRIQVPTMSTVQLVRRACAHYNELNPDKDPVTAATVTNDSKLFARLCTNYLRHACTRYDGNRDTLRHLTGNKSVREQVGAIIKGRTLAAIAEAYPILAVEARRQAARTDYLADTQGRPR